jgi:hypothetical protein
MKVNQNKDSVSIPSGAAASTSPLLRSGCYRELLKINSARPIIKLLSLFIATLLAINFSSTPSVAQSASAANHLQSTSSDLSNDDEPIVCPFEGSMGAYCKVSWIGHRRDRLILQHATLGSKRIVAYYGSPLGRGLGILGNNTPEKMLAQLRAQTAEYQKVLTGTEMLPAFHMVVTVADKYPGDDQDYNHRVDTAVIQKWIDWAKQENVWVILDIQPGRGDVMTEIDQVEKFLYEPHVQLAVDPEFMVGPKEIPGDTLGTIDGEMINQIQERLDRIAVSIGQTKVLMFHQFDNRMIKNKDLILNFENVEIVWDADGFGGSGAKIQDYNQYRHEAGFDHGGLKIFYIEDTPPMTPEQVLKLQPMPSIVIYQ